MEQLWNLIYLLAGAIIATAAKIIEERIRNKGDVLFDVHTPVIYDDLSKKMNKEPNKLISVIFQMDVINPSNEYKTCRKIFLGDKSGNKKDKSKLSNLAIREDGSSERLSSIHLKPNSIERYPVEFILRPKNKSWKKIYIHYTTKNNKNKKQILMESYMDLF